MGLMDELRRISERIKQQRHLMANEAATVQASIRPFIRALGYDFDNLNEVRPEYTADFGTKQSEKVDYAIMRAGKPIILFEAKSATVSLSAGLAGQLFRYYATTEARFGILTNGIQYQFYADLEKRNQMDRQPFLTIDMLNLDERLVNELEGFTKAGFDPESTRSSVEKSKHKTEIRQRLEDEYQQPSRELVKHLAKQLYAGTFKQSTFDEFAPIVKEAFDEFVDDKIASRPPTAVQSESSPTESETQIAVEESPIQPVSEGGVEIPVFAEYQGHRFEATLLLTSKYKDVLSNNAKMIRYEGQMLTPLAAAWETRISVDPAAPYASGMDYWRFINPESNEERPIKDLRDDDELRRRLLGPS